MMRGYIISFVFMAMYLVVFDFMSHTANHEDPKTRWEGPDILYLLEYLNFRNCFLYSLFWLLERRLPFTESILLISTICASFGGELSYRPYALCRIKAHEKFYERNKLIIRNILAVANSRKWRICVKKFKWYHPKMKIWSLKEKSNIIFGSRCGSQQSIQTECWLWETKSLYFIFSPLRIKMNHIHFNKPLIPSKFSHESESEKCLILSRYLNKDQLQNPIRMVWKSRES